MTSLSLLLRPSFPITPPLDPAFFLFVPFFLLLRNAAATNPAAHKDPRNSQEKPAVDEIQESTRPQT